MLSTAKARAPEGALSAALTALRGALDYSRQAGDELTAGCSSEAGKCQRQGAERARLRAQHRTILEERGFIYARQLKLSKRKFIEQPAIVPMPASYLPSSISHLPSPTLF